MMQPPADPVPDAMATDVDATQSTQATQPTSQPQGEPVSETHLWGSLMPCNPTLRRVDFAKMKNVYKVGRNQANDIIFPGMKISNMHCVISWDGVESKDAAIRVTDTSSNGTYINGDRMDKHSWRILHDGNEIAFGSATVQEPENAIQDYRFVFRLLAAGPPVSGFHKYYQLHTELGKGSFATVMKAMHRETGEWYAVKIIQSSKLRTPTNGNSTEESRGTKFSREISILEKLKHPNICLLKEVFYEDWNIKLVLEYISGGDLLEYILKKHGLAEPTAQHITYQICDALAYVHKSNITHRDLKPENVLLTNDDPPQVKVADFGLAKAVDSVTMLRTMCGTPCYLAPEVVIQNNNEGYDNVVDSWSVGVIVFSMLTESAPFIEDVDADMSTRVRTRTIDWATLRNAGASDEAEDFIRRLLEWNPATRMTLTHARAHPWLRAYHNGHANDTPPPSPHPRAVTPLHALAPDASMRSDGMSVDMGVPSSDAPMDDEQEQDSEPAPSQLPPIPGAFPASQPLGLPREGSRVLPLQRRAQVLQASQEQADADGSGESDEEEAEEPARPGKRKVFEAELTPMRESDDELSVAPVDANAGARRRGAAAGRGRRGRSVKARGGAGREQEAEEHGGVQRHPRRSSRLVSTLQTGKVARRV
ncbi:kinase-like domain-containing protein [Amylocystis lapponica]|nr:kinase-like domain-containing protein [Amylocystis lapponica]